MRVRQVFSGELRLMLPAPGTHPEKHQAERGKHRPYGPGHRRQQDRVPKGRMNVAFYGGLEDRERIREKFKQELSERFQAHLRLRDRNARIRDSGYNGNGKESQSEQSE